MPFKKPSEIKADAQAAAQRISDGAARVLEEHRRASDPVEIAAEARRTGRRLLEVQLTIGSSSRDVVPGSRDLGQRDGTDPGPVLSAIEDVGWTLTHAQYVYVPTGESSRDKFVASGQFTAISGELVGIYLFRARE